MCLLLFMVCKAFSQLTPSRHVLPVTVKDLEEKVHPQDSSAAAAYIYRYGNTWFDIVDGYWVMNTEIYSRVKIYKKDGYDYANPSIRFYTGSRKGKGTFSNAVTYNLKDGKVVKTPLEKTSMFEEEVDEDYTVIRVKMPDVHEGSIIEYKYTIRTPHFGYFRDFYFQFDVPANEVAYDVAIPVYFFYNIYTVGYVGIKVAETTMRPNNPLTVTSNSRYVITEKVSSYSASNVKALKDEPYVTNLDNYTGMVKHELSAVSFPERSMQKYATDWESVAREIYKADGFGREVKLDSYFEKDIDPLIAAATTDKEKTDLIFEYVQNYMSWDKEKSYLCEKGVKKAYLSHTGNAAEINLMLTAMLRHAGLDAHPVLVSTRDNGIAVYPTRYAYNYVIAAVKTEGKTVLLDATSKYSRPGILPIRALNWEGRLIEKNGDNEEINLAPMLLSKESISLSADLNADGSVSGKARDQYSDYDAYTFRERYAEVNEQSYIENLEKQLRGVQVTDYKVINQKELDKPVLEEYSFKHNAVADVIGDKMYISPMLFFTRENNPFKQETREFPVDFVYPYQMRYVISLHIPEGYAIESYPEKMEFAMEKNLAQYQYTIQPNGKNLQLLVIAQVNSPIMDQEYYKDIKQFFQKMLDKENEKIVLKRI
ncbi:DUF3857 domain-containing protein [Flavobacterium sp. RHBU_24]|uniref:DUF3857 domain-containing protein n=1 Tax=Flavobacterium sp. RHBU_24 TaxID=3391185 RepID=UPI003984BBAC